MTPSDRAIARVAKELAERARSLPVGARMPSEHQIMLRFAVTRSVARRAIQTLVDEHLVRRTQGVGTFVHERIDYEMSKDRTPSLHATIEAEGWSVRSLVIGWNRTRAPAPLVDHLGVNPVAPMQSCERLVYMNDEPAVVTTEWFVDGVVDHMDVRLGVYESIAAVFRDSGYQLRRKWARAGVGGAPEEVAQRLGLSTGADTWVLESVNIDESTGRSLMCSRGHVRMDLIRVSCEFD